jgi:tRNA nucleotidyltransferase (CCA-adding enzyme)
VQIQVAGRVPAEYLALLQRLGELGASLRLPTYLVGGPVRDLLLGVAATDVDVAVGGDVGPLARALADLLGGRLTRHDRFGTAGLDWPGGQWQVDFAPLRRESYPYPGALPVVTPADLEADLRRRDFTLNAMALRLDQDFGALLDPLGGQADLQARMLRGLHPATFRDDPTRVLRAARYAARLDCRLAPATEQWLREAVSAGALRTVSGPRLWGELERLLGEPRHPAAVGLLQNWGALAELGLSWPEGGERALVAVAAAGEEAALGPEGPARRHLATLALLAGERAADLTADWGLPTGYRKAVVQAAQLALSPPPLVFAEAAKSSTLHEALGSLPASAQVLLWALYPAARPNLQRLATWRDWRPEITGQDLQAAGFEPGPQFSRALQAAWRARLDEGADRQQQLQRALAVLRDTGQE